MNDNMKCRLCQSNDLKLLVKQGDKGQYKYYQCNNCKLVNLDLSNISISENQEKYFQRFNPFENYEDDLRVKAAYGYIKKHVPVKSRFMDIGCGGGSLLYFAKQDGWEVKGMEISPGYTEYVRDRLNVEVITADFLLYESHDEKFDLVSLRHVLEHLPDSILAMNKISDMLKPGGYGHFEFPNINSITHRFQRFLTRNKLSRKEYEPDYKPGHCNEFCKESFMYLLNLTGFELINWETYSFKRFTNFLYNHIKIGTKARAIVRKLPQS
ncbi:MAG: class I SAM-dependent methyltransferase [Bacteroidota bacterium]|nr:class I SAM-dependent methyltransferase [Bacteroidota bacterium]